MEHEATSMKYLRIVTTSGTINTDLEEAPEIPVDVFNQKRFIVFVNELEKVVNPAHIVSITVVEE